MFKIRTTLFFLIASTLHAIAFLPSNFLLPQMFQGVRGADALGSGAQLIPYAVTVAIGTIIGKFNLLHPHPTFSKPPLATSSSVCGVYVDFCTAGQINSRLRIIRPVVWCGYALAALSFGLFYGLFRYPFGLALQEGLLVLAGLGVGLSLITPMLILQAAMPLKEMAAATSAWSLTRAVGGSMGMSNLTPDSNSNLFNLCPC